MLEMEQDGRRRLSHSRLRGRDRSARLSLEVQSGVAAYGGRCATRKWQGGRGGVGGPSFPSNEMSDDDAEVVVIPVGRVEVPPLGGGG